MDYEQAAIYRDYLAAAKSLSETQRVVMHHSEEADVVIPARGTEETYMVVFFVREGKLIGRESFGLDAIEVDTTAAIEADNTARAASAEGALLSAFLNQHYSRLPNIPKEILLTHMPEDAPVLEEYLSQLSGHSVKLLCPQRGEKLPLRHSG